MSHLEIEAIETSTLAVVTGGQAQQQQQPPEGEDQGRTRGQTARQYGAACVSGAGQALMFGGRPRNARQGLATAAMGCAMGVGMKVVDDVAGAVGG